MLTSTRLVFKQRKHTFASKTICRCFCKIENSYVKTYFMHEGNPDVDESKNEMLDKKGDEPKVRRY